MRRWLGAAALIAALACQTPTGILTTLVTISDSRQFFPDTVIIPRGSSVEWKNLSEDYHEIVHDSSGQYPQDLGLAPVGGVTRQYPITQGGEPFGTSGTFPYHCEIHPDMHGVIIVR
jgi:plastocyanin